MAPMIFTKSILTKKAINVFNYGNMMRDFTYIDDIVECSLKCGYKPATPSKILIYLNQFLQYLMHPIGFSILGIINQSNLLNLLIPLKKN